MGSLARRIRCAFRVLFGRDHEAAAPAAGPVRAALGDLDQDGREALVAQIAEQMAQRLMLTPTFLGSRDRVHVGQSVSLVNTLFNTSSGNVHIADYVFFGHNVHVLTGTHAIDRFDMERLTGIPERGRDVVIEQGAWIATNACVIGPCRIGRDAVIGVGSVVTGDVRAGWFYAGCPARPIKPVAPKYADAT